MRLLICDFCGMSQIIPGDPNTSGVRTKLGDIPNAWEVLCVAKTVTKDNVVDICPSCREKYDARYILAQETMSDTMNSWVKGHLIDVKTMIDRMYNHCKDEEEEEE